jgi:hypothetical protein
MESRYFATLLGFVILGGPVMAQRKDFCDPEAAARGSNVWRGLKGSLTSPDGGGFWEKNLRYAYVQQERYRPFILSGTLVSSTPPERPTTLILRMSDIAAPDAKVQIKADGLNGARETKTRSVALQEAVPAGTKMAFRGVFVEFLSDPFMLTLDVFLSDLVICGPSPP